MLVQDEKRDSLHLRFELCTYGIPGSRDFRTFPKAGAEKSGSNIYSIFPPILSAKHSTTTISIMKKVCYGSCFTFGEDSKLEREQLL